jgi:hypothetical protein
MVTIIIKQKKKKSVEKEPEKIKKPKKEKKPIKSRKKLNVHEQALFDLNNKRSELMKILEIVKPGLIKIGVYPWSFPKIKDLIYNQEHILTTDKYLNKLIGSEKEKKDRNRLLVELQYYRENLFYPECWIKIVNKKAVPVKMPFIYVLQMLVNWEYKRNDTGFGAGEYWEKNKDSFLMHPGTVKYIEDHIEIFKILD